MNISVDYDTFVITIPRSGLIPLGDSNYALDTNDFRIALNDWQDSEDGIYMPKTHNHNTTVTIGGVQYARMIEILEPYTITFEDVGSPYRVILQGSNNNILDRTNLNNVSVASNNAAGLISVGEDSGPRIIEGSMTTDDALRIVLAALSGRTSGIGTSQEKYKSLDGETDRITVDFDEDGNRTNVVLDGA
jgi:hypothetical protein